MLNILNSVCAFRTKLCDLIKNYVHHGKKQLHQEVGDGYIFVNIFVKVQFDYYTNNIL